MAAGGENVANPASGRREFTENFTIRSVAAVPNEKAVSDMMRCCSTCRKVPTPESSICEDGHLTCAECARHNLLLMCPFQGPNGICTKPIYKFPCFLYNFMFDNSTISCPGDYCQMKIKGDEIDRHELECPGIEKLKCWVYGCCREELFSSRSLIDHLLETHKIPCFRNFGGMFTHQWEDWPLQGIAKTHVLFVLESEEGFRFVCVGRVEEIDETPLLIIALYHDVETGSNGIEPRISATLEFFGEMRDSKCWSGKVLMLAKTLHDVLLSGSSLNIPDFTGPTSAPANLLVTVNFENLAEFAEEVEEDEEENVSEDDRH